MAAKPRITVQDIEANPDFAKAGFKVGDEMPTAKELENQLESDTDGNGIANKDEKTTPEAPKATKGITTTDVTPKALEQPKTAPATIIPKAPTPTQFKKPEEDLSIRGVISEEKLEAQRIASQNPLVQQQKNLVEAEKQAENIPPFKKQELKYIGTNLSFTHKGKKYVKGSIANPKNKAELEGLLATKKFIIA